LINKEPPFFQGSEEGTRLSPHNLASLASSIGIRGGSELDRNVAVFS
jgi:hypothetical protein